MMSILLRIVLRLCSICSVGSVDSTRSIYPIYPIRLMMLIEVLVTRHSLWLIWRSHGVGRIRDVLLPMRAQVLVKK